LDGTAQPKGQDDDTFALEHKGAFPVYLAKYSGGDWNYGTHFGPKGEIDGGGVYHFVDSVNKWSRGHITAAVTWIDIDSTKLQSAPPPFIVLTGSKDFSLTDQQIKNLRSYIHLGGVIWGDNGRGGLGSVFDVAFRREMKRLIPDFDKKFEMIGPKERIFTKAWFDLTNSPTAASSVEQLDVNGTRAIIYTPDNVFDNSVPKEQLAMNIMGDLLVRY
jgi:hypothetical protein